MKMDGFNYVMPHNIVYKNEIYGNSFMNMEVLNI